MKIDYKEPKTQAKVFSFNVKIYISRIELSPQLPYAQPKEWTYTFKETNDIGITYTTRYSSKNLLALQSHRDKLVKHYQERKDHYNSGSKYIAETIKPSLLQQIKAEKCQKIK